MMLTKICATYWPVPLIIALFAAATPPTYDGFERLFELGAIGSILAVIMWQQFGREKRLADEVKAREDRMVTRITHLEDNDRKDIAALREDNDKLREFIIGKLVDLAEQQSANVKSCHEWRQHAGSHLEHIKNHKGPS